MHVHLIAVAGTGMSAVAGLFKQLGHDVSGSDVRFDPPMGPALQRWGIRRMQGFDPKNLTPRPDLVIVGNVCRSTNVEARAAIDNGLAYTDMAHAVADNVLVNTTPVVVTGTHGKTTTTCLCAWLLDQAGYAPGFLVGGLPRNFEHSFRVPPSRLAQSHEPHEPHEPKRLPPFVIEGDEYDTAFFEKTPKMWHYRPHIAVVTSIEHDHVDIYPDVASYVDAFRQFLAKVPHDGLIVARAADPIVRELVRARSHGEVVWYAVQGEDVGDIVPDFVARVSHVDSEQQTFSLSVKGQPQGEFLLPLSGVHNVGNAIAAIAVAVCGFGAALPQLRQSLRAFLGVHRRQELLATARGIRVYDDFAHHPTAVQHTLHGLRLRHPEGSLFAVFEPRSATACRRMHQHAYAQAFDDATHVIIAPVARDNIDASERLDVSQLVHDLRQQGKWAQCPSNSDDILEELTRLAKPGDTVALLSNGAFGGIHRRLVERLEHGCM